MIVLKKKVSEVDYLNREIGSWEDFVGDALEDAKIVVMVTYEDYLHLRGKWIIAARQEGWEAKEVGHNMGGGAEELYYKAQARYYKAVEHYERLLRLFKNN